MKARKSILEEMVTRIEEVARVSTMETANFESFTLKPEDLPKKCSDVNAFIKIVTKLWRDTWITDQLADIAKDLQQEIERK